MCQICFVYYKGWSADFDELVSVNNENSSEVGAEATPAKQARIVVMPEVHVLLANPVAASVPDPDASRLAQVEFVA